jgi:hypothetical protein
MKIKGALGCAAGKPLDKMNAAFDLMGSPWHYIAG